MDRLALIIGNSNYQRVATLKNPKNDATDMARILRTLGFEVDYYLDLTISEMEKAVRDYLLKLDEFSTGLFFFAGHGMQIDGINFLVPIDCELKDKAKTMLSCFNINSYLEGISRYKGKTNICILDACRDNPYAVSGRGIISGFAPFTHQPKGTIIAYSTSPDDSASDGDGNNGLYTEVLKDALQIPNLKIEEMFKSVRKKVMELSNDKQISWEHSSLVGDFYFAVKEIPVVSDISDVDVYDFIKQRGDYYETVTEDINDIECMPYVDGYNKFNIPIIKLLRAFSRVDYKKKGTVFSDSTIDQLNISYLESWGFTRKNGRWYYKDNYVEMGDPLPLSDELMPLMPLKGHEINLEGNVQCAFNHEELYIVLTSNFPDETPLIFTLKGKNYNAQSKASVLSGAATSEGFSSKSRIIDDGLYRLEISSPIHSVLPAAVKVILGERNRNLIGKNVKFDPISGNTASLNFNIVIKNSEPTVL